MSIDWNNVISNEPVGWSFDFVPNVSYNDKIVKHDLKELNVKLLHNFRKTSDKFVVSDLTKNELIAKINEVGISLDAITVHSFIDDELNALNYIKCANLICFLITTKDKTLFFGQKEGKAFVFCNDFSYLCSVNTDTMNADGELALSEFTHKELAHVAYNFLKRACNNRLD